MSKWKYKSLEWIHKVRAENYKKTKDMSHKEIIKQTKKECEKMKKIFAILFVGLIAATGIVYLSGNEKNKNENMDVHAYVEKNKEQILQQGRSGSVEPMGGWAVRAPMPTVRNGLAIGVVNNKIYAIGGYNYSSDVPLSTNEE
ncbi:MAG: kelch repeat-containing protein [Candidatus Thermoplasmatota archaeon]